MPIVEARSVSGLSLASRQTWTPRAIGEAPVYDTGVPVPTLPQTGVFAAPTVSQAIYDDVILSTNASITIDGIKFGVWSNATSTDDHLWMRLEFYPSHFATTPPTCPQSGSPLTTIVDIGTGWAGLGAGAHFGAFVDLLPSEQITLPSSSQGLWGVRMSLWSNSETTVPACGVAPMSRGNYTCQPVGQSDEFRWFSTAGDCPPASPSSNHCANRTGSTTGRRGAYIGLRALTNFNPPSATALGSIADSGRVASGSVGVGGIAWYQFVLNGDATDSAAGLGRFLDVDTEGSAAPMTIAIFNQNGQLIAQDAGSGSGTNSQLTFGMGRRNAVGDGRQYDGRNFDPRGSSETDDIRGLAAGTYYLAVTGAGALFADGFNAACLGAGGSFALRFATNTNGTPLGTPVAPIVESDLGVLASPGASIPPLVLTAYTVRWIVFATCCDASPTNPVTITLTVDNTHVGTAHLLFDSNGNLVASSDNPNGAAPALVFNSCGSLRAGVYYLAQCYRSGVVANYDVAPTPTSAGRWHVRSREGSSGFQVGGEVQMPGVNYRTRAQAAAALLAPTSGVPIDPSISNVWSPYIDFGFGAGNEGMVQMDTKVVPAFDGGGQDAVRPSYFFWIDDAPTSRFAHPTRFVLVDAISCAFPTLSNGGIVVTNELWWPIFVAPGGDPTEYFHRLIDTATSAPAGPSNPNGLVAGSTHTPGEVVGPPPPSASGTNDRIWGLIAIGDSREDMQADGQGYANDLQTLGCPSGHITIAGVPTPLSRDEFCRAIDAFYTLLLSQTVACERIYIRISSHGVPNPWGVKFRDGTLTPKQLCDKLRKIGSLGVPMGVLIDTCYSGGLPDRPLWDLPFGSTVIMAADRNHEAFGSTYHDGMAPYVGSALRLAMIQCRRDMRADRNHDHIVDDCEAFNWVQQRNPCYSSGGRMDYPGSRTAPNPQKRTKGANSIDMNYNARNLMTGPKTDFHILFRGNVSGGTTFSARSNGEDLTSNPPWSNHTTIMYDPVADTTMVCWENTSQPIQVGQYLHVGYDRNSNRVLIPLRQWWTPTPPVPAPADRAPMVGGEVKREGSNYSIKVINRSSDADGWGAPVHVTSIYRASNSRVPLEHLSLADPLVASLPATVLGSANLGPDSDVEFNLLVPSQIGQGKYLILQTIVSWAVNTNTVTELEQFDAVPPPDVCIADVDDGSFTGTPDGGVTIDDLLYYLFIFEAGDIAADVDDGSFTGALDGGVTIDDLLYYLFRFEQGC